MVGYRAPAFTGEVIRNRILWEGEGEVLWLEPYGPDALRLRSSRSLHIAEALDWTLLAPADAPDIELTVEPGRAVLRNGKITGEVQGDGTVCFYDQNGRVLLAEEWLDKRTGTAPQRAAREYHHLSSEAFETDVYFVAQPDEHFYGLGQEANDRMDLKGAVVELFQKNTKCTIPYVVSSRGYGFIWNNPAIGRVELAHNHTHWNARACKQVDYIVIAGDTPEEINYRYTDITGRAPMLPDWAAGFWQSRLRYTSQEETLRVAREYQQRGIPLSVLVVDYFHWPLQGEWKFDETYWPDVPAMTAELAEMGIKLMVSIWPTVDPRSENYEQMRTKNYLIKAERGVSTFFMIMGPQGIFDATHPGARDFIWSQAKEHYYDKGIRMFWLDEAEPEMRPYSFENVRYYLGNGLEVSNLYPYMYTKAFHDGMTCAGEKEIVNLARCAWLGSQRHGIVLWSGDIASSFDSLRCQIKAGLNVAMCGIPWWTTDIGGFFGGDPADESFRELVTRWFQFGAFCPIFRLHGKRMPYDTVNKLTDFDAFLPSCGDNEIWGFGEDCYGIFKGLIDLRERLRPYIMEQMERASRTGTPVMRPLYYDFFADPTVSDIGDEYLFGPDLLVAPVIVQGARSRRVYLPASADWTDAYTGVRRQGGLWVEADAPLDRIPIYLRDDAQLPILP